MGTYRTSAPFTTVERLEALERRMLYLEQRVDRLEAQDSSDRLRALRRLYYAGLGTVFVTSVLHLVVAVLNALRHP